MLRISTGTDAPVGGKEVKETHGTRAILGETGLPNSSIPENGKLERGLGGSDPPRKSEEEGIWKGKSGFDLFYGSGY